MKQIILNLVIGSLSFIGTSCSAEFENGVSDIDSWEPVSYEFTIKHPCLVHTQADFDYVKSKVDQQAQPRFDGWNKLLESDGAKLTGLPGHKRKLSEPLVEETLILQLLMRQQLINWL